MSKSVINRLLFKKTWEAFFIEKERFHRLTSKERKLLKEIIETKSYKNITRSILKDEYEFSLPTKKIINKLKVERKRIVYSYSLQEQLWLKVLARELRIYNNVLSCYCYSAGSKGGSKMAFQTIISDRNLKKKYGYKIDIKNYFNDIDPKLMQEILVKNIDDTPLLSLFSKLLDNPYVVYKEEIIKEKKGIMAGTPLSSFLASLYLKEMDEYFYQNKINYSRYADDIIVFTYQENLNEIISIINDYLKKAMLELNEEKIKIIEPLGAFDYLGFNYNKGKIDLSKTTIIKTKNKIRRAARSLNRAKAKKDYSTDRVLSLMITKFNRKFFLIHQDFELNWMLWYFPLINTTESLKIIDEHLQNHLRYLYNGSFKRKNYKEIPYIKLKTLNYRTLVNEYYKFKKKGFPK